MSKKLIAVFSLAVLGIMSFVAKTNAQNLTDLYLTIQWWNLTIFSTGSFNFGTVTLSNAQQTLSWQFADYMWVEDLKSSNSGYYTSLWVSNLSGTITGNSIPAANVTFRIVWGNAGIVTLSWTANAWVVLWANFSAWAYWSLVW